MQERLDIKCNECNWTNVGLINIGEPNSPRMICLGCVKRAIEMRDRLVKIIDGMKCDCEFRNGYRYAKCEGCETKEKVMELT